MIKEKSYLLNSVAKACDVMAQIGHAKSGLTVSEIAANLDMPQSTVSKILATLQEKEFAIKLSGGKYKLSAYLKWMVMGDQASFLNIRKKMVELLEQFGETVHFGVRSQNSLLVVDKCDGTQRISITSNVGKSVPLLAVSVGKAIVAFLPENEQRAVVENYPFTPCTDKTITDPERMYRELEKIKRDGYAFDDEECDEFVQCVGVPVLDSRGNVIGGVSISVAKFRMNEAYKQKLASALLDCDFGAD